MTISILIFLLIIYLIIYILFEHFLKKQIISFSPKDFLDKLSKDLEMNTKVTYDIHNYYDIENNEICFNLGNTLSSLFSGLHEFGHAFINIYNKLNVFDKKDKYSISNVSNNSFYYENKEYEKGRNEDNYLNPYLYIILKYSPIIILLLTFLRVGYDNTTIGYINIIFSFISFIFFFLLIKEEYQASKIGYEIIKKKKILDKTQMKYCLFYYTLSFLSYVLLPSICLFIFAYNIYLFI